MYQRFAVTTLGLHLFLLVLTAYLCVEGTTVNHIAASFFTREQGQDMEAFLPIEEKEICSKKEFVSFQNDNMVQNQMISYSVMEKSYCISLSGTDLETFYKIVEAEAGGEDEVGKLLVANVIINRVRNSHFPNSVTDVVYQREGGVSQFTPVSDGRIDKVSVSEETKEIVQRALLGEDVSEGALYFACRSMADPERMKWFDTHLTFLFCHDGHEFFL